MSFQCISSATFERIFSADDTLKRHHVVAFLLRRFLADNLLEKYLSLENVQQNCNS